MSASEHQAEPGRAQDWPSLAFDDWKDTCVTLQLWTQVVGKVRLKLAPMVNHWWQVTLYVTATGLTTSAMPYQGRFLQIDFDFLAHRLLLPDQRWTIDSFALAPCSVADFYAEVMTRLRALGVDVHIWTMPSEIEGAVPFDRDREHAAPTTRRGAAVLAPARAGRSGDECFRGRFLGKCGPRAFLLGQLRPRGHALFRPYRAAADEP